MLTILILASAVAVLMLGLGLACLRIGALSDARAEEMRRRELGALPAVWARQDDDEAA